MAVCSLCVLSIQLCIKNVRVFWPDLPKLLVLAKPITCCSVCHLLQSQAVCSESVLGLQNLHLPCQASFCPKPVWRICLFSEAESF